MNLLDRAAWDYAKMWARALQAEQRVADLEAQLAEHVNGVKTEEVKV